MAKEIVDLLAELPRGDLTAMREKNRRALERAEAEVTRLLHEAQQLDAAVAKRERRKPGRPGALTAEIVLEAARETEPPMTAAAVQQTLQEKGLKGSVNAVRNHLNNLVQSGELERTEDRKYVIAETIFLPNAFVPVPNIPDASPEPADDDIPF